MPNDNYFHLILNLHEDATDTESIYQKAEEVQSGVGGGEPSEDTTTVSSGKDTITATENERNVFYTDVKVFLEGVQVPHTSCAVSYGVGQPPTATIIIPAAAFLRDIPETTKVTVIFKDLVEQDGEYKWRLLFDGELSGITYSIDSNGATMSLSAFHTTAYLTTMQIMTQAGAQYLYNPTPTMIGEFVMQAPMGMSKVKTNIISKVMEQKCYTSMADIVYLIMKSLLSGYQDSSAVGKWYWGKLGNDAGGYKILQRIYGVSSNAINAAPVTSDLEGGSASASGGSYYGGGGVAGVDYYYGGGNSSARQVTLAEVKTMAEAVAGKITNIYIHWSAGRYGQFFSDYHLNVDYDGSIYTHHERLDSVLAHTWRRNTGAIGIAAACAYKASYNKGCTPNYGNYPPTDAQYNAIGEVIKTICAAVGIPVNSDTVMTHAEIADRMGPGNNYGPLTTCERWDFVNEGDKFRRLAGG